jgi:hypothetical protein
VGVARISKTSTWAQLLFKGIRTKHSRTFNCSLKFIFKNAVYSLIKGRKIEKIIRLKMKREKNETLIERE